MKKVNVELLREDLAIEILAEIEVVSTKYKHLLTSRYQINLTIQNN